MSDTGGVTAEQLKSYMERIERLQEEKAAIAADVLEVFAEAKANGFDARIMREILKLRKMDSQDRAEQQSLMDLYMKALGMAAVL